MLQAREQQFQQRTGAAIGLRLQEAGRIIDGWTDMADSSNEELNRKMESLLSRLSEHPMVTTWTACCMQVKRPAI